MTKTNAQLLIEAGQRYVWKLHPGGPGCVALRTGKPHKALMAMAEQHAKYQARHQTQGHQLWPQRREEVLAQLPDYIHHLEENAAESWPWNSRVEAATEMFSSWEHSPGHWALCQQRCKFFGISMARGANGIWYSAMLCAWK